MKKKLLLIILALFTFGLTTNVYAASFYSEKHAEMSVHKKGSTVDEYKEVFSFKERGTNKIAYCIEPFSYLDEDLEYTEYGYNDSVFGYTKEQIDRINDIAYFGYGYGNHSDVKWMTVTQMLIWRTANPNDVFEWVDNLSSRNPINPYQNEINEIENLIRNKNMKPSFITGNAISISNHLELTDTNNVLSFFEITSTSGVNVSKQGNKLIIDRIDGNDSGEISLFRKGSDSKGRFFYNSESQNMMIRGGASDVETKFTLTVKKGSVTIIKLDEDLNSYESRGEAILNGAVFELFDDDYNKIQDVTLDEEGKVKIDNLYIGKYHLKEKTPGKGYLIDDATYDIELTDETTDLEVTLLNKVIESKLKIMKYYGSKKDLDNNTMKKEVGISFDIFDKDNNLVDTITTDENGYCEIVLPYGTYKVSQKNTTSNYQMVDDKEITIDENSEAEILIELNDVEIEVPNASIETTIYSNIYSLCQNLVKNS